MAYNGRVKDVRDYFAGLGHEVSYSIFSPVCSNVDQLTSCRCHTTPIPQST